MKILYLSCHSVLEHDEIKIFTDLGHEVFSPGGAYLNPSSPGDIKRPPVLGGYYNDHLVGVSLQFDKGNLHKELIDWADVIIIMHKPEWVLSNWANIKHKKVVWRSIGQSAPGVESDLAFPQSQGLKLVRYSPEEQGIPQYLGHDAIIRFGKSKDEFKDWNGNTSKVVTVAQSMKSRGTFCHYDLYERITNGYPRALYGPGNEDSGIEGAFVSYEELQKVYRDNRVYFYAGTYPASYTLNFIEALMTGIPIVALGPILADVGAFPNMQSYEVHKIIKHGENGFCSDDIAELRGNMDYLLSDPVAAAEIGRKGRETAIELFEETKIREEWQTFLESL